MKTTKTNHSEVVKSMKAQVGELICKRDGYKRAWAEAMKMSDPRQEEFWQLWKRYDTEVKALKPVVRFHEIMAQDKKYAAKWLGSDAYAYEIIEEKNDKTILVRRLNATLKKDAQKALQKWDFETVEDNPIVAIRKHKDGRWYSANGDYYTIEAEPREHFDYNF